MCNANYYIIITYRMASAISNILFDIKSSHIKSVQYKHYLKLANLVNEKQSERIRKKPYLDVKNWLWLHKRQRVDA